jgi:radical SAM protein with 4Fe4S-binding SPASM domain
MVADARRAQIEVSIITNGSLLTAVNSRRLVASGAARVMVSLETVDPAEFQKLRGGKLGKVRTGILNLLNARGAAGTASPLVGLAVTVLSSTVDAYPKIIEFYKELHLDGGVSTQFLQQMNSYESVYTPKIKNEVLTIEDMQAFEKIKDKCESDLRPACDIGFYERLYSGWNRFSSRTCPWLEKGIYVTANGEITPCCMIKDADRYGWGNVFDADRSRIDEQAWKLAETFSSGAIPHCCEKCPVAETLITNISPGPR